jgi:hypothetical protein
MFALLISNALAGTFTLSVADERARSVLEVAETPVDAGAPAVFAFSWRGKPAAALVFVTGDAQAESACLKFLSSAGTPIADLPAECVRRSDALSTGGTKSSDATVLFNVKW